MKLHTKANNCLRALAIILPSLFFAAVTLNAQSPHVLVFSKTSGFRHASIEAGKAALTKMAAEKNFTADFTEDATQFNTANLKKYTAVVFLSTTGDVLDDTQQQEFERYIQAGGGFVGIHAAADCEYDWPWYGRLVGAWFLDHPMPNNIQKGKYYVVDKNNFATKGMPDTFERTDEFYSFKQIDPTIHVLVKIDETSYKGGKNGDNHPMSWYHDFDGGRSFYTNMGHTDETFVEPLFLKPPVGRTALCNGRRCAYNLGLFESKTGGKPFYKSGAGRKAERTDGVNAIK